MEIREYESVVEAVRERRLKRRFEVPVVVKGERVMNAGVNGFIVGSFVGGAVGCGVGVYRMFKHKRLSRFPAAVLAFGLTAGVSLSVLSLIMK